jgi:hypothetical protein
MFLPKYSLDKKKISLMFHTQYTPDFFVEEYYCLRNTTSWGNKDLASGSDLVKMTKLQEKLLASNNERPLNIFKRQAILKGQCHEIFDPRFFFVKLA